MTSRQLSRLGRYWQRKLGLWDWQITMTFATAEEMHDPTHVGECAAQLCDRTAVVYIRKDGQSDYEIELTLVHEELHVLYCDLLPRDPMKAKLFEAAIDQTAASLMQFKRGAPHVV